MDTTTAQILVFGSWVIAFGWFASYMAERQEADEAKCGKSKSKAAELRTLF